MRATWLVTAVLLSAGLATTFGVAALPPSCAPAEGAVGTLRATQDDAGSGDDAPDTRAAALALDREGYFWGYLDPAGHPAADLTDWYTAALAGAGETVMTNLTANYSARYVHTFLLEVYEPGATTPTHTTVSDGGTITFVNAIAGIWGLRITPSTVGGTAPVCAVGQALVDLDAPYPAQTIAQNHGLYFGCHPVCANLKAP